MLWLIFCQVWLSPELRVRFVDVVFGWVRRFLLIASELAVAEHGVQHLVDFEACSSGDGGLVDPLPGDRLGEHIGCGFVPVGDDVGVVGVPASGQRRVETAAIDGAVDEEETRFDGAALGSVTGLRIAQFDILDGVVGRETHAARLSGDGDGAVGVDGFDGPVVPVLHHDTAVGAQGAPVAAGNHLVTDEQPLPAKIKGRPIRV